MQEVESSIVRIEDITDPEHPEVVYERSVSVDTPETQLAVVPFDQSQQARLATDGSFNTSFALALIHSSEPSILGPGALRNAATVSGAALTGVSTWLAGHILAANIAHYARLTAIASARAAVYRYLPTFLQAGLLDSVVVTPLLEFHVGNPVERHAPYMLARLLERYGPYVAAGARAISYFLYARAGQTPEVELAEIDAQNLHFKNLLKSSLENYAGTSMNQHTLPRALLNLMKLSTGLSRPSFHQGFVHPLLAELNQASEQAMVGVYINKLLQYVTETPETAWFFSDFKPSKSRLGRLIVNFVLELSIKYRDPQYKASMSVILSSCPWLLEVFESEEFITQLSFQSDSRAELDETFSRNALDGIMRMLCDKYKEFKEVMSTPELTVSEVVDEGELEDNIYQAPEIAATPDRPLLIKWH